MANRLIRNTAILAKSEVTYGTDPTPTGVANAILVSNVVPNILNAQNVDRAIIRPFLGGSEQLLGTRFAELGFDVELVGSGTVATAPAWAPLLRACGFAETLTATFRADYLPISDFTAAGTSVTMYWYDDGVLHKLTGARGNVKVMMKQGERPMLSFSFVGIYTTPSASSAPALTLTGFLQPQVVVDANTGDLTFGATHATATAPLLTGGTVYPSMGIELDMNNSVNFTALLGGETVDITNREAQGKISLDLTAAQEVTLMGNVEGATLTTVGISHGTVANRKSLLWLPSVQLINPSVGEVNGKRLINFDFRAVPVSGNDEVRIVTSF